tara:strand:- start:2312 stop:2956 length:645 start_codon:yes stop_codon:yes gene_type:complete
MAKIHQNAEKFPIRWNGNVEGGENQGDSIPSSLDIKWGVGNIIPYTPCWDDGNGGIDGSQCTTVMADLFVEDLDINQPGNGVDVLDAVAWISQGRSDITNYIVANISGVPNLNGPTTKVAGSNIFTWGDVSFIQEIMDGIGTGSRRARQDRLNKILDDEDKKKKLIHLICRIKGEKVYDDYTEVGSVEVDVDDVELVVESIMGKKLTMEIKSGV